MLIYCFRPTVIYMITHYTPKIVIKTFCLFFPPSIRMSRKIVNFRDKKNIKKATFIKKQRSNQDR